MFQASKMELGSHHGCGFRDIPSLPRIWVLWSVSESRTSPAILKQYLLVAASFNLLLSRSLFWNCAVISDLNQSVLNKHPYFLAAPIIILEKQLCNFSVFALVSLPHFVVRQNTIQVLLNVCRLGYSPQFGSNNLFTFLL